MLNKLLGLKGVGKYPVPKFFLPQWLSMFIGSLVLFSHSLGLDGFSFIVLGDLTAGAKVEVFEQIIDEVKTLAPDFVINVGDLIEGYTENLKSIESEWSYILNQLNRTNIPYHLTPGNHDIWSVKSESIYIKHFGKTFYSFDYKKYHFTIIDNSRYDSVSQISKTQLKWLKQDLAKHKKAPLTFCFMHKPFWNYPLEKDEAQSVNQTPNQAEILHNLFKENGVDYVFSGHDHHYFSHTWDSIIYFQVGPSGSRYKIYDSEKQGAFQNYLLVKVQNQKTDIAVIKPGSILPFDIVTAEIIHTIDRIENKAIKLSETVIPENQPIRDTIGLNIQNVTNILLNTTLRWNFNSVNWQISPESVKCILPVSSNGYYKFNCKLINPENLYPLPEISLSYPYLAQKEHPVKKILPVQLITDCLKINKSPIIDGILNDNCWIMAQPLTIFGASDTNQVLNEKTYVCFIYDENNLYIGVKCYYSETNKLKTEVTGYDDAVYKDDHLNFLLQPYLDSTAYYQIFINPIGTISDRRCWLESGKSRKDSKWNLKTQIKTKLEKNNWTIEMAIPLNQFPNYSKTSWGFNFVRYQPYLEKLAIYQVPFVHNPETFARLRLTQQINSK